MSTVCSFVFSLGLLASKPAPVFAGVHLDDHGPYRFLVDTGAQSSLINSQLAAEPHLQPAFRAELVTTHSTQPAPALKLPRSASVTERSPKQKRFSIQSTKPNASTLQFAAFLDGTHSRDSNS